MDKDLKVLVTGAGGFIGGWVVESFYLEGLRGLRAGVRNWSSGARVGRFPVEIVLCDVMNTDNLDRAVAGVDVVVHCAVGSVVANTKGTANVLEASLQHGVKRVVHLSTIDVYGVQEGEVDESTQFQLTGSDYGDSKIEAENLCWKYQKQGLPIVVLRPTIVYGPYCKLWIAKFAERLRSGNWGLFEGVGEGTCNLVYVKDLVRAIALSIESPRAVGEAFIVNGSEILTWNEYFRLLNAALGFPELKKVGSQRSKIRSLLSMPVRYTARYIRTHHNELVTTLYQKSNLARSLMKMTESSLTSIPSTSELSQFTRKSHYPITKAKSTLGFDPRTDVKRGLEISALWFRHEFGL